MRIPNENEEVKENANRAVQGSCREAPLGMRPQDVRVQCTKNLAPLREFIGQERAIRAVEFGLNMVNAGYNIYVAGITGTGKTSMVKTYIERIIKERRRKARSSLSKTGVTFTTSKNRTAPE